MGSRSKTKRYPNVSAMSAVYHVLCRPQQYVMEGRPSDTLPYLIRSLRNFRLHLLETLLVDPGLFF